MRKQLFARMLALCLAVILTLGMVPMNTEAAELVNESKGTITISGIEDAATATVYRLMDVKYNDTAKQPQDPMFTWVEAVREWVQKEYSAYINTATNAVTETFSTGLSDAAKAEFYDKLAVAIKAKTVDLSPAGSCTGDGNIKNLTMGNYFILIENGMKVYRPSAVNLVPVWNSANSKWEMSTPVTIEVKASELAFTKALVSEDDRTVKVTDSVEYKLEAKVPNYPVNATNKGYRISDNLPNGVTLKEDTIVVKGITSDNSEIVLFNGDASEIADTDSTKAFTLTTDNGTNKESTPVAVDFVLEFNYEKIRSYDKIVVTYSAIVNKDIVLGTSGNTNTAYLDYNNNPYSDGWKVLNSTQTIYSYGINVTKKGIKDSNDNNIALADAEFTLTQKTGDDSSIVLTFEKDQAENYYYLANVNFQTASEVLKSDSSGTIKINGLEPGTYYLTETKAPNDYILLQNPIEIQIDATSATNTVIDGKAYATVVEIINNVPAETNSTYDTGIVPVTVINKKGFSLPTTGGEGTLLFSIIGLVMMGAGFLVIFALLQRRQRAK